jgi:two-component system, OmpR family, sensor histidine kinase CiaH
MIKSLQKRISTLFIFLLTIIWLVILFLFINNSYRNNLSDLQQTVRAALHYTTWDAFVISNGQTSPSELDHIPYCLFSIDESNEMEIMFDTFSDVSDKFLLKQGKALISNNKKYIFFKRYVSVNHLRAKKGQYYVLMLSGTPALKSTLPTVFLCFILALIGIIVFTISSKALSRWMVKPIENTILSEKKFISNASHELKTPLSVISANAELLSSEVGRDNKHLLYIQQETSRMISLVQKMLTLTRLDAPQIQNTHAVFPVDDALLVTTVLAFAVIYYVVFRITSKIYYRIVGNQVR